MKCKFDISTEIHSPSGKTACDGSIRVRTRGGHGPFKYSIDGGCNFQNENVFDRLKSGCYALVVSDSEGCRETRRVVLNPDSCDSTPNPDTPCASSCTGDTPVYVPSYCKPHSSDLTLEITSVTHPKCGNSGSFSIMAVGGCLPYRLRVRGPVDQSHCLDDEGCYVVSGLKQGPYYVTLVDAKGVARCHKVEMIGDTESAHTKVTCDPLTIGHVHVENVGKIHGCQGSIAVYATGGCGPYRYRLNGGPYQSDSTFAGLDPGNYTVYVKDALDCQVSSEVVVGLVCFTRDSFVETDQGLVRVDRITDRHTVAKRKIKLVCSGALGRGSYLVKVGKNALGRDSPQIDTFFTTNHRIVSRGRLVKAGTLARQGGNSKIEFVRVDKPTEVFNVLLEQYGAIKVNGLEVETLHPDSVLAQRYLKK